MTALIVAPAIILVYTIALFLGSMLVVFPSASSIYTDPLIFGFSQGEYGLVFLPQMIFAIIGSLWGPQLAKRIGLKAILAFGMMAIVLAMGSFAGSVYYRENHAAAYKIVLVATSFTGLGFGFALPILNRLAQKFFPKNSAIAITALHSLMGIGTAASPILISILHRTWVWWAFPIIAGAMFVVLLLLLNRQPLEANGKNETSGPAFRYGRLSVEFWIFILVGIFYGFCETMFANWAIPYLTQERLLSATTAAAALSFFWIMLTVGRILIAFGAAKLPFAFFYRGLPTLLIFALWAMALAQTETQSMCAIGLAGFACSAFFPLTFSFAQDWFVEHAEMVSGALMAAYMLGYGLASFAVGYVLESTGLTIATVYQVSSVLALCVLVMSILLTRRSRETKIAG